MNNINKRRIVRIALYAGEILLKNGAETYRTEDTIDIICRCKGLGEVSSFVTPTGIFVSDNRLDGLSYIKRIKSRTIDLDKISKVNDFARKFVKEDMDLEDALMTLKEIDEQPKYKEYIRSLFTGLASSFFALLFGASWNDFILAFLISMIVILVNERIHDLSKTSFISDAISGVIISLLTLIFRNFGLGDSTDMIIVGSIMPLVPGVALTNGLRDFISGDLISGVSRVAEAILIAISIAAGVGSVFKLWIYFFGGLV